MNALASSTRERRSRECRLDRRSAVRDGGWVANSLSRWSAVTRGDRRHRLDSELGTKFLKGQNVVRAK